MKIKHLVFIIFLLTAQVSLACDICGCANSGSYFGLMPKSHKSVIGLRYRRLHFVTHADSKVLKTEEHFNVGEVYARLFPIKRVQVMAFLPYRIDKQVTSADVKKQNGMGDITVLANYNILNTFMDKETSGAFNHTLMLGGGVKLPTGDFKFDENNTLEVANANFQLGTGSTDLIVNAFYTINKDQWGLATNISRKFNTANSQGYRFGDQVFGTVELYRSFNIGSISLTPSIGVYGEHADHGKQQGKELDIKGGRLLNGTAGVTFFSNKWTLGVNAQKPVAQKSASGHVVAKERLMVQVGFLF
ncbi:transporter [Dyadobacter sp. CY345]|uniref:transporter n=1 Tax=Dyadobacter sp. CY345 TaxID=2909335 RepID=UPI001F42EE1E|nr:transporter [Dyadobacter sp. CY345]MCF2443359.1 transporter [Dyadobacter sp. CY345]